MRFPIIKNKLRVRRRNVQTIIWACAVLHNFINCCGIPPPEEEVLN